MKELKGFINGLKEFGYCAVSINEVFDCDNVQVVKIGELLDKIKDMGIKEVIAEYYESFEFFANDGKYIEINGIY